MNKKDINTLLKAGEEMRKCPAIQKMLNDHKDDCKDCGGEGIYITCGGDKKCPTCKGTGKKK